MDGMHIHSVGGKVPAGATVIDAEGATLMPGLIDSHVHTDVDGLHDALLFRCYNGTGDEWPLDT